MYRLFDAIGVDEMAATLETLLTDNRSAATTKRYRALRQRHYAGYRALRDGDFRHASGCAAAVSARRCSIARST